jgi:hypothetical protein
VFEEDWDQTNAKRSEFDLRGWIQRTLYGTLRKKVLTAEWFHSTRQAQNAINVCLRQFNRIKPHHTLNMKTPIPETLFERTKMNGAYRGLDSILLNLGRKRAPEVRLSL